MARATSTADLHKELREAREKLAVSSEQERTERKATSQQALRFFEAQRQKLLRALEESDDLSDDLDDTQQLAQSHG